MATYQLTCPVCDTEFTARRETRVTCSRSCRGLRARLAKGPLGATLYDHQCIVCGIAFKSKKRKQLTCCISCRGRYGRNRETTFLCAECGSTTNNRTPGHRCQKCRLRAKRKSRRNFYHRHRGRIQQAQKLSRQKQFGGPRAQIVLRHSARERDLFQFNGHRGTRLRLDGYTCQDCASEVHNSLVVHHLQVRTDRSKPDTTSTPADLVTLCRGCHVRRHRLLT